MLPDTNAMIAALKAQNAPQSNRTATGKKIYTVTAEWLEKHDEQVRKQCLNRKQGELRKYAHDILEKDFNERQALLQGDEGEILAKVFALVVAAPCRILVRDFGWTPLGDDHKARNNMKLARFGNAISEELEKILTSEILDIRKYAEDVYSETGIMFGVNDE